jgi:hypothetical protein
MTWPGFTSPGPNLIRKSRNSRAKATAQCPDDLAEKVHLYVSKKPGRRLCSVCYVFVRRVFEFCSSQPDFDSGEFTDIGIREQDLGILVSSPNTGYWMCVQICANADLASVLKECPMTALVQRLDSIYPSFKIHPSLPMNTGSSDSLAWTKEQLRICGETHLKCISWPLGTKLQHEFHDGGIPEAHGLAQGPKRRFPSRVLDLTTFDPDNQNCRVRVQEINQAPGKYACLSYCWGIPTYERVQLTRSNHAELMNTGFSFSALPAGYKDILTFTKGLGYEFLWIDALCIIQDDESDKSNQIFNMHLIYRYCDVVIAVVHSNSIEKPCFSSISPEVAEIPLLRTDTSGTLRLRRPFKHPQMRSVNEFPLLTRGWTLQELLLPYRMIQITRNELIFRCRTHDICQCGDSTRLARNHLEDRDPIKFHNGPIQNSLPADEALDYWFRLLSDYSERKFTVEVDRYHAIQGLMSVLSTSLGSEYYCGLWPTHIWDCLLWDNFKRGDRPTRKRLELWPTWSWLSVMNSHHGIGHWTQLRDGGIMETTSLCSIRIESVPRAHPIRHLQGQYRLVIKGTLIQAVYEWQDGRGPYGNLCIFSFMPTKELKEPYFDPDTDLSELEHPIPIYCVPLVETEGNRKNRKDHTTALLVMQPISWPQENCFERIGVAYQNTEIPLEECLQQETITTNQKIVVY